MQQPVRASIKLEIGRLNKYKIKLGQDFPLDERRWIQRTILDASPFHDTHAGNYLISASDSLT